MLTLTVDAMGNEGEGIARDNGFPFFVKGALPGEKIVVSVMKVKKNYGFARLEEILVPSGERREPVCPVAVSCGGCQLLHVSYEEQLRYKEQKVLGCLSHIGRIQNPEQYMEPIIGMEHPYGYRNKAQYPVGRNKEGRIVTGFYAGRTHQIKANEHCAIQAEGMDEILAIVRSFMEQYHISPYDETTQTGSVRHVLVRKGFHTGQWMVCIIINEKKLPHWEKLVEALKEIPGMTSISINQNQKNTNVILGDHTELLYGAPVIEDRIGDITYEISPESFYQVNPVQTERLYEVALSYAGLTGKEVVWDLYCGIGTISLFLARKAKKVYGVEIVPQAVKNAEKNRAKNQISNVEFYTGAAEEIFPQRYAQDPEGSRADVVVVDPPRKGCDQKLLETICRMGPERIVYVSCDPATLARDILYLTTEGGYELQRFRATDMFPQGGHVECVTLLQRKDI
ncbi:MAG: 23S rRNA (uracil(1939)-C(5))-methyltransferase RlmD [Clostridiales bacterium]|nr:23S rRNA (uracil(1939)-C(5))-methyltransferase RlmD [Clostridiales bacterium]